MNDSGAGQTAYRGDAALEEMLKTAGSALTVAGVRALVAGVLAAPQRHASDEWVELVAERPGPHLRGQLEALRIAIAAATPPEPGWSPARVAGLRAEMAKLGLAGFLVPRADEHQGEYVARASERLAWISGFTGSAGMAVILADRAAVFTDGRYTLQVRTQVDERLFECLHLTEQPPHEWLLRHVRRGDRIGFDPWLHTVDGLTRLRESVTASGGTLVPVERNPLDAAWTGRPPVPLAPVVPHPPEFAGRSADEKIARVAEGLGREHFAAAVITAPDSIAWLLNVRGGDVAHTPLPLSFALARAEGTVDWFVDPRKLTPATRSGLGNRVRVQPPDALGGTLAELGRTHARVVADSPSASFWIVDRLEQAGATVVRGQDPCALPKACKTADELAHIAAAHRRDGAALVRFLAWLAKEGPLGRATELDAMERLEAFRREGANFRDTSFTSIAGAGPNGAIVHYRSSPESNRRIAPDMLFLIDSGGQYLDGTTDVTRTIAIGTPTAEQRDRFTRVLKGHIAIATARFPAGTTGSQIDALARMPLWEAGLDFDHGTGHGVGYYLSVHEGPQRVSKLPNTVALQPGMVVSNEPGYYKTGEYGIRIENLVTVVEVKPPPGAERKLLGFETLTLAPIDRALVEPDLLTARERDWLNAYHARVRETVGKLVEGETAAWLEQATRAI